MYWRRVRLAACAQFAVYAAFRGRVEAAFLADELASAMAAAPEAATHGCRHTVDAGDVSSVHKASDTQPASSLRSNNQVGTLRHSYPARLSEASLHKDGARQDTCIDPIPCSSGAGCAEGQHADYGSGWSSGVHDLSSKHSLVFPVRNHLNWALLRHPYKFATSNML